MIAFETVESSISADILVIAFTQHDFIGGLKGPGTFNAVAARLFGLSYPDYLRFMRDNYNGKIMGRQGYSYITFDNSSDCDKAVKELNRRWNEILKERTKRGLKNIESGD